LLYLTSFRDADSIRAWKSHDWDAMDRLHVKGFIDDPKNQAKLVCLSPAGVKRSRELFEQYFGVGQS